MQGSDSSRNEVGTALDTNRKRVRWYQTSSALLNPLTTLLFIPTTSCDCERTFSLPKNLLKPERIRLTDEMIEDMEYLKSWIDTGVVTAAK
jgi:hypothetical protein